MTLKDKTLFITGGSRGIGKAIALRAARDGARVVIAAKTTQPHPTLPGTIYTAAEEIEAAGGQALAIALDIRDEAAVAQAMQQAASHFGGIDVLVNNASAISLTPTLATPPKRYDLMHDINVRGTFFCCQSAISHLRRAANPHILTLSPPLNLNPRWFAPHLAYTMSKYAMSMTVLGLAEELRGDRIAANALWPRTVIQTAALRMVDGAHHLPGREPDIMADAAYWVLTQPSSGCTGNFFIDEDVLRAAGETDFSKYTTETGPLMPDLFLDD